MFFQEKLLDYYVEIPNDSGGDYDFEDLILKNGSFGNVVNKDGIPNGERGIIDSAPNREIQTSQLDGGATFALDSFVYSEENKDDLLDAPTASTWRVGVVTQAKGSNTYIKMRTLVPQIETT